MVRSFGRHKGAKSAENEAKLLPIVAPCIEEHLEKEPVAMLAAPSEGGGTHRRERCLSSEEGAESIRNFLKAAKTYTRRISTHSLKPTAIFWRCKAGLSEESRALLARHASSVKNPVALYSRDLLSSCSENSPMYWRRST